MGKHIYTIMVGIVFLGTLTGITARDTRSSSDTASYVKLTGPVFNASDLNRKYLVNDRESAVAKLTGPVFKGTDLNRKLTGPVKGS
jgi:hypothetical protein